MNDFRVYNKEELPLGVQLVIDSTAYEFGYCRVFDTHCSLYTESGFCYETVSREDWDI